MGQPSDRDTNFMMNEWGTNKLITDYGSLDELHSKLEVGDNPLPEISGGMKEKFEYQNDIHSSIRNDNDYDDWEYGTEPIIFR
jgi:hypothetical protein